MRKYRIISMDGGGIRGLVTATLLSRIQKEFPTLLSQVDLFAGTSTGGILALALANGKGPEAIIQLYKEKGPDIFYARDSWISSAYRSVKSLFGAKYPNDRLYQALSDEFGEALLLRNLQKHVLVPSYRLDNHDSHKRLRNQEPKFFHNFSGSDSDGAERVLDVAMRTSAAPTYFPVYQGYIDGGVAANNPSIAALAQALNKDFGNQEIGSVRLLSLGTGDAPSPIDGKSQSWGLAQWARPLVNIFFDGSTGVTEYECKHILGSDRFFRLSPNFFSALDIDQDLDSASPENIEKLYNFSMKVDLSDTLNWIRWKFLNSSE
jgi:patatin-like phospholipase/acyl hydrolase